MSSRKPYIPKPVYNPVVQAKKIEDNRIEIKKLGQTIELITASNERHYQLLGNFARHDMKNIIINMNSILELYRDRIPDEVIEAIQLNTDAMSATMNNFQKLVPHADTAKFKFNELISAVRILISPVVDAVTSDGKLYFDMNDETEINLPFQALLQMVNNIVVNAVKAVEGNIGMKKIDVSLYTSEGNIFIVVSDNGCEIPEENRDKIYDFRFSTTGGSGIGLNHAKFLCEKFNGNISLSLEPVDGMHKSFIIKIPIQ